MAAADNVVLVNSSAGARSITLPAPTNGRLLTIKDSTGSSSTHAITILPNASETIDGASSLVLNTDWASTQLVSDGTNWFIESDAIMSTGGTVTSVALTVPSFLAVSGSPITTSGTLAVTLNTETANTVFSGPSSGGAATPTFRSLVAADIPGTLGATTFTGSISATNLSGTNTGDITLTAVGSSPNADAASLSGQALTLQPADGTHPGVVTTGSQTLAGAKTFTGNTLIAQATASQATVGISGSSAQHQINGGLVVTTNTVSANYSIV